MHRSTIGAFSIDVPSRDVAASTAFWRAALSRSSRPGTVHPEFEILEGGRFGPVEVFLQDVGSTAVRVHLDVQTDDVEAGVGRSRTPPGWRSASAASTPTTPCSTGRRSTAPDRR